MQHEIVPYLFIPGKRVALLDDLARKGVAEHVRVIIDLEDSLRSPNDPQREAELKAEARAAIVARADTYTLPYRIFIRINNVRFQYWRQDAALLRVLAATCPDFLSGIVIPKAEEPGEIEEVQTLVEAHFGRPIEMLPLIESRAGLDNLEEIVRSARHVRWIAYGHHDYFLDANHFPIPDSLLTSAAYREVVRMMLDVAAPLGIGFIDSVHTDLDDLPGLRHSCDALLGLASSHAGPVGKLALNPRQAVAIGRRGSSRAVAVCADDATGLSVAEKTRLAAEVIAHYENRADKNLGVCRAGARYVSPQAYFSAKRWLNGVASKYSAA